MYLAVGARMIGTMRVLGTAGILLMTERDHAQPCGLEPAGEVGDRNAGQAEDRIDAVELESVDDELEAVGFRLTVGLAADAFRRGVGAAWGGLGG